MVSTQEIQDLKSRVNIVDIIGDYLPLTKAGRHYLGLCPFHGEKTPSFNVNQEKQFYHCFGCGKSGDVYRFVEEIDGIPFMEAVTKVARFIGETIEVVSSIQGQPQRPSEEADLIALHEEAAIFYQAILLTSTMGTEALAYLESRGLSREDIEYFGIGLAPDRGSYLYDRVIQKFNFGEERYLDSGLFHIEQNKLVDSFYNRIMFPLTNVKGQVIGFSGRIFGDSSDQQAKYKNSRRTKIFNKSFEFYHLDQALPHLKKAKEVYLMEGFMDVIAAYRAGVKNAIATMGTALTAEHVQRLRAYQPAVVLAYDGDDAGQAAIEKSIQELKGFSVEVVRFAQGMDPDEYLQAHSPEDLRTCLQETRMDAIEFLMDYYRPSHLQGVQAQLAYVEKLLPFIAALPTDLLREVYTRKLSQEATAFDVAQLEQMLGQVRVQLAAGAPQQVQLPSFEMRVQLPKSRLTNTEQQLLHRLIHHSNLLNEFRFLENFHFVEKDHEHLYQLLLEKGQVTSQDLDQESEEINHLWYQILELNLPPQIGDEEIEQLVRTQELEKNRLRSKEIAQSIQAASQIGRHDQAVLDLNELIAQKRKME
ncbi:DNA primase [Streptococcus danieliae]|uniref:DNA primase n=1 Tax=Streptococcus danieliae TaxID=747656 RepID=A0A7Z0LBL9_9STRE|nr:DNA primase [Streptococcus danieliae]MBF0716502.1 DNA primase [Streptococcus danieliae]NYS48432.1 DNA primase [Streptococcus danieliae]